MEMAERLLLLIKKLNLNKSQFSDSIKISSGNFSDWINPIKQSLPSTEAIFKISAVHKVNLNWLFTGEGRIFFKRDDEKPVLPSELFTKLRDKYVRLPIVAPVSCGEPIEIEDIEPEGYVYIREDFIIGESKGYIGFRAEGNSMIPEIKNDDVIILKLNSSWDEANNHIAVVRINNEVTLKRVQLDHQKKIIILKPYCSDYKSIILNKDEIEDSSLVAVCIMIIRDIYKKV